MHFPHLKAIVFDLDNTLLDHTAAERKAISKFLPAYFDEPGIGTIFKETPERFIAAYRHWNEILWHDLAMERISADNLKWQRFALPLRELVPTFTEQDAERLGRNMGATYLSLYADGWQLLPDADEILHALGKRFRLGLITNGFSEQQRGKIARFGWESRFDTAILSGEFGVMKPHKAIFDHALKELGIHAHEAVYVGDHYETDVVGALGAGWRAIWFNPHQTPRSENRADRTIFALSELLQINA